MAFQPRQRWMISKLEECLGIQGEAKADELVREGANLGALSDFLRGDGPPKIFFFYQTRDEHDGHDDDDMEDELKLYITDGKSDKLRNRAVWFMRPNPLDGSPPPEIDLSKANDGLITFGCVEPNPLESMQTALFHLYQPLLGASQMWGKSTPEQHQEFTLGFDKFVGSVTEALKGLSTGLELRKPDKRFDLDGNLSQQAMDVELGLHVMELLQEWCTQTEAYLDDGGQRQWETTDAGPSTEIEYWRHRMQRLTSITEQLKTKECKAVIGVLSALTKISGDGGGRIDRQRVYVQVRRGGERGGGGGGGGGGGDGQ
jgi:dynein heavy chain